MLAQRTPATMKNMTPIPTTSIVAVMKMALHLGFDLSEEDGAKVYDAFRVIADKKEDNPAPAMPAGGMGGMGGMM